MTTITIDRAVVEQALEALESVDWYVGLLEEIVYSADDAGTHEERAKVQPAITALKAALAQQAEPDAYGYASRLAVAIWEKHYKDTAPHWKPLDDLVGVLTQIDNMAAGMIRRAQQAESVPPFPPVSQWNRGCAACGAHGNATGYVCPRSDCPTKVTCGGVA